MNFSPHTATDSDESGQGGTVHARLLDAAKV